MSTFEWSPLNSLSRRVCMLTLSLSLGVGGSAWAQANATSKAATSNTSIRAVNVAPVVQKAKKSIVLLQWKSSLRRYERRRGWLGSRSYRNRQLRRNRRFRRHRRHIRPWRPHTRHNWLMPGPTRRWRSRTRPQRIRSTTGFTIDAKGFFVTRYRAVRRAKEVRVVLLDGRSFPAKLVGKSRLLDLAVFQAKAPKGTVFPSLQWASSRKAQLGEAVLALGRSAKQGLSVSVGVLSSKGSHAFVGPIVRTDASIYRMHYGAPLLNHKGQILGLIRSKSSMGAYGLASDTLRQAVEQLKTKGRIQRAKLGVSIARVTPHLVDALKLRNTFGALVRMVTNGTPAAKAGIKPSDVIIQFNGYPIQGPSALQRVVALSTPGRKIEVVLMRDGKEVKCFVQLVRWDAMQRSKAPTSRPVAKKKAQAPALNALKRLGVGVRSLEAAKAKTMKLKSGLVELTSVEKGGLAGLNGLQAGDVIVEVNRTVLRDVKHFLKTVSAIPSGENVLFLVRRGSTSLFVAFALP